MKNKLLVSVFAMALVGLSFTSCKEKTDFDAIVNQISKETLKGYFSGSEAEANNLVMRIAQYQFLESDSVIRTVLALGDGVNGQPATRKFASWSFGEYNNGGKGRYLTLDPGNEGGEPLVVNFINGGIVEEGQPEAIDQNNKIKDVVPAQDNMVGKNWYANDTVWFTIDTTVTQIQYDTIYTYKPKKDPETGKTMRDDEGHVIYEQTIKEIKEKEVPVKQKKKVTPTKVDIRQLVLSRDPQTFANTGTWYLKTEAYSVDKTTRKSETLVDSLSTYNFHWSFENFTSSSSVVIKARQDGGKDELFEISYDAAKEAITLQQQVLTVVE